MRYDLPTKTARMTAVRDMIDAAAAPGRLQIGTAGMATVLRELVLNDPCGTVSGDTLTLAGFPKSDATGPAGVAAAARIVDGDGVVRVDELTAGVGPTFDINLVSATAAVDQALDINGAAIRHAA
ncbi:UNVERIFIED_ORG: hypothetical protein LHJ69_12855 [Shinella sp. XGS7]|nr:hypothetical protein [Shinella sp. XGS7]